MSNTHTAGWLYVFEAKGKHFWRKKVYDKTGQLVSLYWNCTDTQTQEPISNSGYYQLEGLLRSLHIGI